MLLFQLCLVYDPMRQLCAFRFTEVVCMLIPSSLQVLAPMLGLVQPVSATMSSSLPLVEFLLGKTLALNSGLLGVFAVLAFSALKTPNSVVQNSSVISHSDFCYPFTCGLDWTVSLTFCGGRGNWRGFNACSCLCFF